MDRPIVYSNEQHRSFDWLNGFKDFMKGGARLAQALLGPTDTICFGLSAAAKSVPNLSINVQEGQIFQWATIDGSPYGSLATDSDFIYQSGFTPAQELVFSTANLAAGQSMKAVVRARFVQVDAIRQGDPTNGVLPYYSSSNPTLPLQGVNNNGQAQPTVRNGFCELSIAYGNPATTGSEVAPLPGTGYVGLYVITLTFGQTTITNGQILAAPAGIPGYPPAPIWKGVRNQHHLGTEFGQAPRIDLTSEVDNILGLSHLPATNTVGLLPTVRTGANDPNGITAGNVGDLYLQTGGDVLWICKTAGSATTAVWIPNTPVSAVLVTTFPYTITQSVGTFFCQLSSADGIIYLPPGTKPGRFRVKRIDDTDKKLIVTTQGSTKIKDGSLVNSFNVLAGQSFDFENVPANDVFYIL